MSSQQVFYVVRWEVGTDGYRADGRAYADIRLGDVVTPDHRNRFTVVEITTYGRVVDTLSAVMTGTVLLRGDLGAAQITQADALFATKHSSVPSG